MFRMTESRAGALGAVRHAVAYALLALSLAGALAWLAYFAALPLVIASYALLAAGLVLHPWDDRPGLARRCVLLIAGPLTAGSDRLRSGGPIPRAAVDLRPSTAPRRRVGSANVAGRGAELGSLGRVLRRAALASVVTAGAVAMRRALVGALGWLAISAASAACAGDETQGFKLSDHECWGVPPVTVRIGPETFGPDWKPFTAWVPGPAPACSYAITMSPDAGFVDDGDLCIARFELVLHPPRGDTGVPAGGDGALADAGLPEDRLRNSRLQQRHSAARCSDCPDRLDRPTARAMLPMPDLWRS